MTGDGSCAVALPPRGQNPRLACGEPRTRAARGAPWGRLARADTAGAFLARSSVLHCEGGTAKRSLGRASQPALISSLALSSPRQLANTHAHGQATVSTSSLQHNSGDDDGGGGGGGGGGVLRLTDRAEWQYSRRELDAIEVSVTRTSRGSRLACMFVRCAPDAPFTLLFSHGNAVDLGQMSSFYLGLGTRLGCNVFSYDYSGYGGSSGKPSEKNLYADIEAAWHVLRNRYAVLPENIILYGQSIGTVPTVDLASRYECAAIVLHSPLMSGMRVAFPNTRRTYCFDAFPSIDKISQVSSPVLVIHGTEDEVIDFSHGLAMYERCQRAVEPLWVEGAGHNDVELYGQYLERLKRFVTQELPQRSVP
ncbi:unnamed protein product [Lampetra planeri]